MNIYEPTYLYVKQHSVTGLKYFGKTIKEPTKYIGSGKYWLSHIKKHDKEHVITLWYQLFEDKLLLTDFALLFSEHWDITESNNWANLKHENGLDGGGILGHKYTVERNAKISASKTGMKRNPHSEETKVRMSIASKGKPKTKKHRDNMSISQKGNIKSLEHRDKLSIAQKGIPKGKQLILTCTHCSRTGGNSMRRWHFDNCKLKPINDEENDDG